MTCQEVVDSKCRIGKISCNYNISLTIYFQRNAVKTNLKFSLSLMVLLKFLVTWAHTLYIVAPYISELLFLANDFRALKN